MWHRGVAAFLGLTLSKSTALIQPTSILLRSQRSSTMTCISKVTHQRSFSATKLYMENSEASLDLGIPFISDSQQIQEIEPGEFRSALPLKNSSVMSESKSSSTSKIASYRELLLFINTTIIIMLSEPMLSLVDTTIVGKFASTVNMASTARNIAPETLHLASLGPATMLCDNAFYLTYFLAIATTNQLAKATATEDHKLQVKTTEESLGVASIFGIVIAIVIFGFGDSMLKYIIGEGGAVVKGSDMTSDVIALSWDYTKIRGIIAPITIMGMIAQSVCLSTLDTRTPALAVLAATIVNIMGDVILVAKYNLGLRGAALATAAAGLVSSFLLINETRKKVKQWRHQSLDRNVSNKIEEDPLFMSIPDFKSFISLAKLAGPIFFVIIGKLICYSAMTLKASDFGMMSLAAHNIMLRVFFFFCVFGDSFSLAAQSFLPAALYGGDPLQEKSHERSISDDHKRTTKALLKRIFSVSGMMAIFNSMIAKLVLTKGGRLFTNDVHILSLLGVTNRVFYMMGSVLLHPIIMTLEGSILATRDLRFLVSAYAFTMSVMLFLLKFGTNSFTGVWRALFSFQLIRCIVFGGRVFTQTRESRNASEHMF